MSDNGRIRAGSTAVVAVSDWAGVVGVFHAVVLNRRWLQALTFAVSVDRGWAFLARGFSVC